MGHSVPTEGRFWRWWDSSTKDWRRVRCDRRTTKVVVCHLGESGAHTLIVPLEHFNGRFDSGNEALLPVSGHFRVHPVAFSSNETYESERTSIQFDNKE